MKAKLLIVLSFILLPFSAHADERYLDPGKVVMEKPLEEDVLNVNTALGFCTVLEFPEKPMLVTVGDNSLIQIEVPQNSKNVVIKPLQESGETNLFVFTPNQRFNYKVTIGSAGHVDYVLDADRTIKDQSKRSAKLTFDSVLNMARNYDLLKSNHAISDREFMQKNIYYQCAYPKVNIAVIEAFENKDPNYLILHIVVQNIADDDVNLNEKKTNLMIGNKKIVPQYVLFDSNQLEPTDKTDGWLVLENSYVSLDNQFSISLGLEDEEYVCSKSVS